VIEASWFALVDAIRLELMRLTEQDETIEKAVEDYCWACSRTTCAIIGTWSVLPGLCAASIN